MNVSLAACTSWAVENLKIYMMPCTGHAKSTVLPAFDMPFTSSPLANHASPDLESFRSWLLNHHVYINPSIELRHDRHSGWGVNASRNIARGEILCGIPRSLVFSARTASLDTSKWPEPETAAELILRLTACLLHELRLGSESSWFGWLQFVPRDIIRIPVLWADEAVGSEDGKRGLEWLEGTEAGFELEKKNQEGLSLADLHKYHADLDLPPTSFSPEACTLTHFLYAYSLVSSRGFALDSYHFIGLIPFCDMFNHSSSSPHTSLSIDACVCQTCGSLLRCPHDSPDSDRLAHLSAEYLELLNKEGMADKVDMRAQVDIASSGSKQVFSCYDEQVDNAKLLVEYGFTEEGNTSISWPFRQVMDGSTIRSFMGILQSSLPSSAVDAEEDSGRGRLVGLQREEQPEPLVLRSNGEISRNLFIALYLQTTDKSDLEDMEAELASTLGTIEKLDTPRGGGTPLSRTAGTVVDLLEARIAGIHRNELSLDEIADLRNSLPVDSLERLGMGVALAERKLLETTIARWRDLIGS